MKGFRPTILIIFAAFLTAACGTSATPPPSTSATAAGTPTATATPEPSATALPPLTIGLLLPFTESAVDSELGVAQKRAAELYVQSHGGMLAGRTVQFVYADESVNGPLDVTKATGLIEQEHADVLLGLVGNDGAYAVRTYIDDKKVVTIDTNASANALTRASANCTPSCASPYLFRSSFSNWQLSEPLGEWAAQKGNTDFYLSYPDSTYGTESAAAFVEGLVKRGGMATGHDVVSLGSDWSAVVATIKGQPTKHVFAAYAGSDAVAFIDAWAQAGMSKAGYSLFGPGLLTDVDVLGKVKDKAAGITTSLFWTKALDLTENRILVDRFSTSYQNEDGTPALANGYVVEMWDAMKALDAALGSTGGSTASLVGALEAVQFDGARGHFSFDPVTHNVVQDVYIRTVSVLAGSVANTVIDTIPQVADPGK